MDDIKQTIVITGGCGFIGHHVVETLHKSKKFDRIVILDKLSYATEYGLKHLKEQKILDQNYVSLLTHDLVHPLTKGMVDTINIQSVRVILHMAAESHVDTSISNPLEIGHNNVMSTLQILQFARQCTNLQKFIYFSTDEVFGTAPLGTSFKEGDRHHPSNPYSASKSASEMFCVAYANTYKLPIVTINCMNVIGERQLPEKFIPKVIFSILNQETLYVHMYKDGVAAGSRFYIDVLDLIDALFSVLEKGEPGQTYNIRGFREVTNMEVVDVVSKIIGKTTKCEAVTSFAARPGHDVRYDLDGSKLKQLTGWQAKIPIEVSLKRIVDWTLLHLEWLK